MNLVGFHVCATVRFHYNQLNKWESGGRALQVQAAMNPGGLHVCATVGFHYNQLNKWVS